MHLPTATKEKIIEALSLFFFVIGRSLSGQRQRCQCKHLKGRIKNASAANDASMRARFSPIVSSGQAKRTAAVMLPSLNHTATAPLAMALVIVMLTTTTSFAGSHNRKPTVVVHPRYVPYVPVSPYAPYYYSRWNPYSLYSIYDHLSGGRQLCRLPSEPCDNEHRVQN
jgi:hypothetical protein